MNNKILNLFQIDCDVTVRRVMSYLLISREKIRMKEFLCDLYPTEFRALHYRNIYYLKGYIFYKI